MPKPRAATRTDDKSKALFKALENRDLKAFQKALTQGADIHSARSIDDQTPLKFAMDRRADACAIAMIESGVEVRSDELDLIWAVLTRRPDIVRRFIEAGADLNVQCTMGTPLRIAANPPNMMQPGPDEALIDILRQLIQAGADINQGTARGTPLEHAVMNNRTETALLLIGAGARVETSPINRGMSPLSFAVRNGNLPLAQALINAGADVTECDQDGLDALALAKNLSNLPMIQLVSSVPHKKASKPQPHADKPAKPKKRSKKKAVKVDQSQLKRVRDTQTEVNFYWTGESIVSGITIPSPPSSKSPTIVRITHENSYGPVDSDIFVRIGDPNKPLESDAFDTVSDWQQAKLVEDIIRNPVSDDWALRDGSEDIDPDGAHWSGTYDAQFQFSKGHHQIEIKVISRVPEVFSGVVSNWKVYVR